MRKRGFVVAALGLAACLVAGGLFASNMGFKLNYGLDGPGTGGSLTGTNSISLPYNQQVGLVDAEDVFLDLPAERTAFTRFVKSSNGAESYDGTLGGVNFPIQAGEGYFVSVSGDTSYVIVGSHNPSFSVPLDGPGTNGSLTGASLYSYPYHSVATTAEALRDEINNFVGDTGRVTSVGRLIKSSNGAQNYAGQIGDVDFALVPGESYFITVTADTSFVPAHF